MQQCGMEWNGTDMELSLEGYKLKVKACRKCIWGEKVEKRSELMVYVHLPLLCYLARINLEIAIVSLGTQGRVDQKKSSQSCCRGIPSHTHDILHNSFKSEYLIL